MTDKDKTRRNVEGHTGPTLRSATNFSQYELDCNELQEVADW